MNYLLRIFPIFGIILIGIYFYFFLNRIARCLFKRPERGIVKAAAAVISAAAVVPAANIWSLWAAVLIHLFAFAVLTDILYRLIKRLAKDKMPLKLKRLYLSGAVPVLLTAAILGWGFYNMRHVIRTDYTVYTEKAIQSAGYRAALVSDLHFGTTMDEERLEQYCREIEAAEPDFLILCGDIVDEHTSYEGLVKAFGLLGGIDTKYGVFYVYGNHDRATYSPDADFTPEQLDSVIGHSGIQLLREEAVRLTDDLIIAGREDRYSGSRTATEALLNGAEENDFIVLADHQPVSLAENEAAGVDLQLSGHTHGGQIWPVGLISDWLGFGEMNYGYQRSGNFQVIVTSGMAGWGYPVRTGHHSEYVIIDIKSNLSQ